jgi:hypothetical protein
VAEVSRSSAELLDANCAHKAEVREESRPVQCVVSIFNVFRNKRGVRAAHAAINNEPAAGYVQNCTRLSTENHPSRRSLNTTKILRYAWHLLKALPQRAAFLGVQGSLEPQHFYWEWAFSWDFILMAQASHRNEGMRNFY